MILVVYKCLNVVVSQILSSGFQYLRVVPRSLRVMPHHPPFFSLNPLCHEYEKSKYIPIIHPESTSTITHKIQTQLQQQQSMPVQSSCKELKTKVIKRAPKRYSNLLVRDTNVKDGQWKTNSLLRSCLEMEMNNIWQPSDFSEESANVLAQFSDRQIK